MKLNRTASALIAGSAALALTLAGCSPDEKDSAATSTETTSSAQETTSTTEHSENAVILTDAYIKEKPAEKNMTGIFGVLTNNTDKDLKITSFKIEGLKEGTKFEQHKTENGKMFEVPEGLTIPADGKLVLEPGSTHFMVMNNDEALEQGSEHTLVIELSDGSSITQEVEVRVQAAGEESYGDDGSLENPGKMKDDAMEGMDHSKMDSDKMDHSNH